MKIVKQFIIFFLAIFFCALGTAITTQAYLGTTPISSLPYLFTFLTPISFGTTTFIINCLFLLLQVVILRKEFKKIDYLQILMLVFFGYFLDLSMYWSGFFITDNYILKIIMLIIGSAVLGLGVTLERIADYYIPGEGLVRAITYKTKISFDKIKIAFDVMQPVLAIVISLIVLHNITGIREGTIISAFLVGTFVGIFSKLFKL